MNDPRSEQTKLVTGAFHADWADGDAAIFARLAAAHARRRVLRRRLVATAAATATLVLWGVLTTRHNVTAPTVAAISSRAAPSSAVHGYEVISDAELLSELRDRPVLALKTPSGAREFVVLPE
jgi:hypothetical protein